MTTLPRIAKKKAKARPYAASTSTSLAQTREAMEKLLRQHGGTAFAYYTESDRAGVAFQIAGRHVRILLDYAPLETFYTAYGGTARTDKQANEQRAQHERSQWRALLLLVKSKLVAVSQGITTVEREFFSDTVLSNDQTVFEYANEEVARAYRERRMPQIVPPLGGGGERAALPSARPPRVVNDTGTGTAGEEVPG